MLSACEDNAANCFLHLIYIRHHPTPAVRRGLVLDVGACLRAVHPRALLRLHEARALEVGENLKQSSGRPLMPYSKTEGRMLRRLSDKTELALKEKK